MSVCVECVGVGVGLGCVCVAGMCMYGRVCKHRCAFCMRKRVCVCVCVCWFKLPLLTSAVLQANLL